MKQAKQTLSKKKVVPLASGTESMPGCSAEHDASLGGPMTDHFAVVGIGASAGGLAAFESFFSGMPKDADPGMAFVLVQHLAPDHKSILTDLLRRCTRMQVYQVEDGMVVKPNCAYIIPPNRDMAFLHGRLHLMEPSMPHGLRLPIDFFFRSLAQDQQERAICIVLSGTGSDGTLGVRAIKGEGGMVMVQSPDSTEYDGMPRSAIATGLVDYELPPAEMPNQLIAYLAHAFGKKPWPATLAAPKNDGVFKKILILLRAKSGHDFSQYKPSTIHRRIDRRLAVNQIDTLDGYVSYLQQSPAEVEALFRDLLIGVTHFFRDPEAFKGVEEQVIPRLFADKPAGSCLRIWSAGCSTGEEAYSLAILLYEHMSELKQGYKVQVFATDIDGKAIATARAGVYPASIASDISPERLSRFFTPEFEGGLYRIHKVIRDMLVFSEQDLVRDPPFSKLDLISCRTLLIYMGGDLQKRLIPLFHYALNPGGFLFQGTSETVGDFGDLFSVVDRKLKLYQRKEEVHGTPRVSLGRILPSMTPADLPLAQTISKAVAQGRHSLRDVTEQALLEGLALTGMLINGQGDILYLHGRAGLYLELVPGEVGVNNILKMAREGLRRELTTALHKATRTHELTRCLGLGVKTNAGCSWINLAIQPVNSGAEGALESPLFLVVIEEVPPADAAGSDPTSEGQPEDTDIRFEVLKQELRAKEEYLKASNEELETSNEELKSANEEMQSVNEELQSANEELETSKEELQSVNEELATVNAELQAKVADLSRVNNDMNNLLAGTGIGTVFVDHHLRILRFTPAATRIINLIPSDVGRPVGHLVSNLIGYDRLVSDVQAVLNTLVPMAVDVQTIEGKWYRMCIQLYRTLENVIEGAVITFVEVTEVKRAEAALGESESLFHQLAASLPQLVWTCCPDGCYDYVSPQWIEFIGLPESQQLGLRWFDQAPTEDRTHLMTEWNKAVATGESFHFSFRLRHHSGEFHAFETQISAFRDATGHIVKWFGLNTDLNGRPPQGKAVKGRSKGRQKRNVVPHE